MVSLADALRELRGKRSQRAMAVLVGMHLRSYTRLEQGALCRFPTIDTILTRSAAPPRSRAFICLAWFYEQVGQANFKAATNQLIKAAHPQVDPAYMATHLATKLATK